MRAVRRLMRGSGSGSHVEGCAQLKRIFAGSLLSLLRPAARLRPRRFYTICSTAEGISEQSYWVNLGSTCERVSALAALTAGCPASLSLSECLADQCGRIDPPPSRCCSTVGSVRSVSAFFCGYANATRRAVERQTKRCQISLLAPFE